MMALLNRLTLTNEQRIAVSEWKQSQRRVSDASGPLGKRELPAGLWQEWNDSMQGVYDAGLDPQDYLRSNQ